MNKLEILEALNQIIDVCQVNGNAYVTNKTIAIKESLINMWDKEDFHYLELIKELSEYE